MVKIKKIQRAQVTIFIIIAIIFVIIIIVGAIFINKFNKTENYDSDYSLINSCLKDTSEQALTYIGNSGGYYNLPIKSTKYGTPYYFYDRENLVPNKSEVEKELGSFIEDWGKGCGILDENQYKENYVGNLSVNATIYNDRVNFKINYPISFEKNNRKYSYENFDITVFAKLGNLYNAATEYIQGQTENLGGICINCVNDIANKYDIKVISYDYNDNTVIFNLWDNSTKINHQDYYVYSFACSYNISDNKI